MKKPLTPSPVNASLVTAPVWRRIAALIYDALILLAISFIYGAVVTGVSVNQGNTPSEYQPMFNSPVFLVGWLSCLFGFYCWFWHKSGQTIGMKTWRLQLVQKQFNDTSPTWTHCVIRCFVAPPLVLLFGSGYIYQWLNADRDCLQDKLSKTRVILLPKDR